MSDHELLLAVVGFGVTLFIYDAIWKIFGTQRRLDRIERKLGIEN